MLAATLGKLHADRGAHWHMVAARGFREDVVLHPTLFNFSASSRVKQEVSLRPRASDKVLMSVQLDALLHPDGVDRMAPKRPHQTREKVGSLSVNIGLKLFGSERSHTMIWRNPAQLNIGVDAHNMSSPKVSGKCMM
jgi:hypothetical protein